MTEIKDSNLNERYVLRVSGTIVDVQLESAYAPNILKPKRF